MEGAAPLRPQTDPCNTVAQPRGGLTRWAGTVARSRARTADNDPTRGRQLARKAGLERRSSLRDPCPPPPSGPAETVTPPCRSDAALAVPDVVMLACQITTRRRGGGCPPHTASLHDSSSDGSEDTGGNQDGASSYDQWQMTIGSTTRSRTPTLLPQPPGPEITLDCNRRRSTAPPLRHGSPKVARSHPAKPGRAPVPRP